jgi:hypothetical protein
MQRLEVSGAVRHIYVIRRQGLSEIFNNSRGSGEVNISGFAALKCKDRYQKNTMYDYY